MDSGRLSGSSDGAFLGFTGLAYQTFEAHIHTLRRDRVALRQVRLGARATPPKQRGEALRLGFEGGPARRDRLFHVDR